MDVSALPRGRLPVALPNQEGTARESPLGNEHTRRQST